ncbi:hypothetical protein FH972_023524 [Carpinus fangiana]|uniref:Uncharacterized protein n=1 Tax=Carpinus fangiana TaxID=176857 RepID=A0A5N6KVX0_9ROSI|nr:hypothetical protein FH972_023524 [Carpinus fangiana]
MQCATVAATVAAASACDYYISLRRSFVRGHQARSAAYVLVRRVPWSRAKGSSRADSFNGALLGCGDRNGVARGNDAGQRHASTQEPYWHEHRHPLGSHGGRMAEQRLTAAGITEARTRVAADPVTPHTVDCSAGVRFSGPPHDYPRAIWPPD